MTFPPMAIASIFHRLSGIVLFIFFPWMLYSFALSKDGAEGFAKIQTLWATSYVKLILLAFFAAVIYHFLAGIRHMIMDLGYGESLVAGRRSAIFVIALSIILTLLLGIKLWLAV